MPITLKEAELKLIMMRPFNTGTLRAEWYEGYERPMYAVYSYAEKIAEQEGDSPEHRWLTEEKFSQTTSKHLNIVKRAWGIS